MRLLATILWFVLIDLPLSLLRVAVAIVGPVMVLLTLPFAGVREGMKHLPMWVSWWGNPTYGTFGNDSYQNNEAYNPFFVDNPKGFWSQWYWLVVRNPANGLVSSPLFSLVQADADDVRYWGQDHIDNGIYGWQFLSAQDGWRRYTGFYAMVPYCPWFDFECRVGFKILPNLPTRKRPIGMTFIINPFKRAARR